ncbi:hypothetical protein ACWC10_10830 [Streptomyces sp. NPDC001595]|uniref:hypothetical protein n=1 Tax=Streptomyces sp. NPDC001532 TaxID=3154520 RepID=UPI003320C3F8
MGERPGAGPRRLGAVGPALLCLVGVNAAAGRPGPSERAADPRAATPDLPWESEAHDPHPPRTLTTRVDFTAEAGAWRARVRHTLEPRPSDGLLDR